MGIRRAVARFLFRLADAVDIVGGTAPVFNPPVSLPSRATSGDAAEKAASQNRYIDWVVGKIAHEAGADLHSDREVDRRLQNIRDLLAGGYR